MKKVWTKEKIVKAIDEFVKTYNRLPKNNEYIPQNNLPSYATMQQNIGMSISEYYMLTYPNFKVIPIQAAHKSSAEEVKRQIDNYVKKNGKLPQVQDFIKKNGLPSKNTAEKHLGMKVKEYLLSTYPEYIEPNAVDYWDKEKIVSAINKFVSKNQRIPKQSEFTQEFGLPTLSALKNNNINARKLCIELYPQYRKENGLDAAKWTKENIIKALDGFIAKHNRLPKISEFRQSNGLPAYPPVRRNIKMTLGEFYKINYPDKYEEKLHNTVSKGSEGKLWTGELVKRAIDDFVINNERIPHIADFKVELQMPPYQAIKRSLGMTLTAYCEEKFPHMLPQKNSHIPTIHKPRWTEETVKNAIDEFVSINARIPKTVEFASENNLPSVTVAKRCLGVSPIRYCMQHYSEYMKSKPLLIKQIWTEEMVKAAIDKFVNINARIPMSVEFTSDNNLPSSAVIKRCLGITPIQYCKQNYAERIKTKLLHTNRAWTEETVKQAIDSFINKNDRLPKVAEYRKSNGLPCERIARKSIGMAFAEYYKQNYPELYVDRIKHNSRMLWTEEMVKESLDDFIIKNGRLPKWDEYRQANGLPGERVVRKFIGSPIMEYYKLNYPELYAEKVRTSTQISKSWWTEESVKQAIDDYIDKNNKLPKKDDFNKENGLPIYSTATKSLGMSLTKYYQTTYPELLEKQEQRYQDEVLDNIKKDIDKFVKENGYLPVSKDFTRKNGLPTCNVVAKYMGMSLAEYYQIAYPELYAQKLDRKFREKEREVKEALDRFIKKYGHFPQKKEYSYKFAIFPYNTARKYVGMQLNEYFEKEYPELFQSLYWTEKTVKEKIDAFIAIHSRFPKYNDFYNPDNNLPSYDMTKKCLGMKLTEYRKKYYPQYARNRESIWDEKTIRESVDKFIEKNGRLPFYTEFQMKNGMPPIVRVTECVGSVNEFYANYYPEYNKNRNISHIRWSVEEVLQAIDEYVKKYKRFPKREDFTGQDGMPYINSIDKNKILLRKLQQEKYPQYPIEKKMPPPKWSKEKIINLIEGFYERNKRMPGVCDFENSKELPSCSSINTYIGSIQKLYAENYPKNTYLNDKDEIATFIKEQIDEFVRDADRIPDNDDYGEGIPDKEIIAYYIGDLEEYYITNYPEHYVLDDELEEEDIGMTFSM